MTGVGVLLGTAAYMAPEQAKGQSADRRSDIWAFGCVLFEMLTGEQAFAGNSVIEVLASIIRDDPKWDRLPAGVNANLLKLLRRCLAKNPKDRLPHAASIRFELEDAPSSRAEVATSPVAGGARWQSWLPWATSAVLAAVVIGQSAFNGSKPVGQSSLVSRLSIPIGAAPSSTLGRRAEVEVVEGSE